MVLDDSERIRAALEDFVPVMQEISPVCDTNAMQERLKKAICNVTHMQQCIMEPHAQLQHATEVSSCIFVYLYITNAYYYFIITNELKYCTFWLHSVTGI